jgi:transposase
MKAYSTDLRERIVRAVADGQPQTSVARRFGVGVATVRRYVTQQRTTGTLAPKRHPGPARRIGAAAEPALRAQVAAAPDATLAEHCAAWEQRQGVRVSGPTMCRALARLGWPLKKRPSTPASKTPRPARPGGRR